MGQKNKGLRQNSKLFSNKFFIFSILFFTIKLLIVYRISNYNVGLVNGKVWLGADGENYLKGVNALVKDGAYSKESILNYWPAGYPLTLYFLSFFGKSLTLTVLSVFQSAVFSISIYLFILEIQKTKIKSFAFFIFLLLSLNPKIGRAHV